MVGNFRDFDPRVWPIGPGCPFNGPPRTYKPSLSAERFGLSLSRLVPEILGPTIAVIFYQNVLFNRFTYKHFISIFTWISIRLTFFSLVLDLLTPHFYKTLDPVGYIFYHSPYRKFSEVPPHPSTPYNEGGVVKYYV